MHMTHTRLCSSHGARPPKSTHARWLAISGSIARRRATSVHPCGEHCNERITTEEFEVCRFTGRFVGALEAVHHWQRKGPHVVQTHSMPKRHVSVKSLRAERHRAVAIAIQTVIDLFTGSARHTIRRRHELRLKRIARLALRKNPSLTSTNLYMYKI